MFTRIFVTILIFAVWAQAQILPGIERRKTRYGFKVDREPAITYQLFVQRSKSWKPVIYLAVSIQNDHLTFEKTDNGFRCKFRVNVAIRHEKTLVTSNTWDESAFLQSFNATNSRRQAQYRLYRLPVFDKEWEGPREGKFQMLLEINDLVSGQSFRYKRPFTIHQADRVRSTEIAFLKRPFKNDSLILTGSGEILKFSHPAWGYLRYKTARTADDSVTFNIRLYLKEDDDQKTLFDQKFLTVPVSQGICDLSFELPYNSMDEGHYLLRISKDHWEKEKSFRVVWFAKPTYLYKYDLAIRPMRYILDEKTLKRVKHLSYKELEKWFKAYWKKRDPTPNTVYNELMVEFFRRVAQANRKFSTRHKEGWETDRGRIYILYGAPTRIDDHRYATQTKPYQVWVYGDSLQFLFVDRNGNGEFNLIKVER